MRPATTSNLSFHSSSDDCDVRPHYIDMTASASFSRSLPSAAFASPLNACDKSEELQTPRLATPTRGAAGPGFPVSSPRRRSPSHTLLHNTTEAVPSSSQVSADLSNPPVQLSPTKPSSAAHSRLHPLPTFISSSHQTQSSPPPQPRAFVMDPSPRAAAASPQSGSANGAGPSWFGVAVGKLKQYVDWLIDPLQYREGTGMEASASPLSSEHFHSLRPTPTEVTRGDGHGRSTSPFEVSDAPPLAIASHRIVVDATDNEPFSLQPPLVHLVQAVTEEEQLLEEAIDVDDEPTTIEVDLMSALQGYIQEPSECYGHLVAAALNTRSIERPVTGVELSCANRNPFLVRLVVNSDSLDLEDPVSQQEVQATVDQLIAHHRRRITPALYEYLLCFLKVPSVRLTQEQYVILKTSGFEYIALMYGNQHVLPKDNYLSVNYSRPMHILGIIEMILGFVSIVACTVAIWIVFAYWVRDSEDPNGERSNGFYTFIVFGCGYAVNLIAMIFFLRLKQDELVFEDVGSLRLPSPFVNVFPAIPVFDALCLITYIRSLRLGKMAFSNNVLASSRLSCICFAMFFAVPQLITQAYLNHDADISVTRRGFHWSNQMLKGCVFTQWAIALVRFVWMMLVYDSTNGLGFACFCIKHARVSVEHHSGVPHVLLYVMMYVLESNVYLIILTSSTVEKFTGCEYVPVMVFITCGITAFLCLVTYGLAWFSSLPVLLISFTCVPIVALQVVIFVLSYSKSPCAATVEELIAAKDFLFVYVMWITFLAAFLLWLGFIVLWRLWSCPGVQLPYMLWRYPSYERGHRTTVVGRSKESHTLSSTSDDISSVR